MKGKRKKADQPARTTGPQQARSRISHNKVLQATERLMTRLGTADFSLPDVSRESGMSIGGIYRRFKDKQDLLLAVQERLNEQMSEGFDTIEAQAQRHHGSLRRLTDTLTAGLAELVRRHAPMIKAIMEATWVYPEVAKGGKRAFAAHRRRFKAQVLALRPAITHPDPDFAAEFCFVVVFELLASHFGVGRRARPEHSKWPVLVKELQLLCYTYLAGRRD